MKLSTALIYIILIVVLFTSCEKGKEAEKDNYISVSIYPLKLILQEITQDQIKINVLLSKASSPHTYSPQPKDVKIAENSKIFFYVAENLDGWISKLPLKVKYPIFPLIPNSMLLQINDGNCTEHHTEKSDAKAEFIYDPHFWSDPIIVKAISDTLTQILNQYFPEKKEFFEKNTEIFKKRLDSINNVLAKITEQIKNRSIFLYHPSILYFIKRYELSYGGSIEEAPGKELSPKEMQTLLQKIQNSNTKAIFTEPQLPKKVAQSIAQELKIKTVEIDPLGDENTTKNYFDFLTNLAEKLVISLK